MSEQTFFVDRTDEQAPGLDLWPSVVIPKEAIDAEIERLAGLPVPASGVRRSLVVHPQSKEPGLGLAPGIRVALEVLRPGERTKPVRQNSTQVNFCIQGGGTSLIGERRFAFRQYDVTNTPSMAPYVHVNDTKELQVRLTYSNAALLEKMNIHVVEDAPDPSASAPKVAAHAEEAAPKEGSVNPFGTFELQDGAYLMPYEKLINPDVVPSLPLHWPWEKVKMHVDKLEALGQKYRGRRLYLLFNPATGRTNGTTHNFFATMTLRPANITDRPHRHTAAAINYYFQGSGHSQVEGKRIPWKAGDLMLSAPGWAIHNHASHGAPVYELTIQDSPLNIAMESLLWQERLDAPFSVLGSWEGFETNRALVGAGR
jgi:gentisate 1,2-dioxygenase